MYYTRHPHTGRVLLTITGDILVVLALSVAGWFILRPAIGLLHYVELCAMLGGALIGCLAYLNAYSPRRIASAGASNVVALCTMGIGLSAAAAVYFLVPFREEVAPSMAFLAGGFLPVFLLERGWLRRLFTSPRFESRVLIAGASDLGREIAEELAELRGAGIRVVGFLSDELAYEPNGSEFAGVPVVGKLHHLEKRLLDLSIDHVVVASKNRNEHFPEEALLRAKLDGCVVESGACFYERLFGRVYMRDLRASYFIFAEANLPLGGRPFQPSRLAEATRRALDVLVAGFGLALASPLLALCAIAIKLDSRGDVFYRQERVGRGGKTFKILKLRSMRQDAEAGTGETFAQADDERVTAVGEFLRKSRLDEIPQLLNILRGDMTLVGPRAERSKFGDALTERYRYFPMRQSVKPGLTGWAQTRFGYVSDFDAYERKIALDLYYLTHRSLLLDLAVLVKTFKTVVHFRGL